MKKIKKIITALGTNRLNQKLQEFDKYEVIGNDIPYQEGVIQLLESGIEVDIIIISDLLERRK